MIKERSLLFLLISIGLMGGEWLHRLRLDDPNGLVQAEGRA